MSTSFHWQIESVEDLMSNSFYTELYWGFTGFYWVLLSFPQFDLIVIVVISDALHLVYWILLFNEFYI